MNRILPSALCFGLLLPGSAAIAQSDLTAEGVWSGWQAYFDRIGAEITGQTSQTGTGVQVEGMVATLPMRNGEDGALRLAFGDVEFAAQGDGSVRIALAETIVMEVVEAGDEVATITLVQSPPVFSVSGTVAEMVYRYATDQATLTVDPAEVDDFDLAFQLGALDMTTEVQQGQVATYTQSGTVGTMGYTLRTDDGTETVDLTGTVSGLVLTGDGALPENAGAGDDAQAYRNGLRGTGGYAFDASEATISLTDQLGTDTIKTSSQGGNAQFGVSADGFLTDVNYRDLDAAFQTSDFPAPLNLTLGAVTLGIEAPFLARDAAQDFRLNVGLVDLAPSDTLWSLFDPGAVLPRDPASVALTLSGAMRVLTDFMDAGGPPNAEATAAQVEQLSLDRLEVNAVGARLTGAGAFEIDNTDYSSFFGLPKPVGKLTAQLVGGNGLLDRLVSMGLLSPDDALGARFMVGMVARPGDGEDTLVTEVEINDQGHVIANGQRLQ